MIKKTKSQMISEAYDEYQKEIDLAFNKYIAKCKIIQDMRLKK